MAFYTLNSAVRIRYLADMVGVHKKSARTYLTRLAALRTLIAEAKADVVVSFLPNVNVAAILASAFTGVPVVISERRDPSSQPAARSWELACRVLYRFADAMVGQTESCPLKPLDAAHALSLFIWGVSVVCLRKKANCRDPHG